MKAGACITYFVVLLAIFGLTMVVNDRAERQAQATRDSETRILAAMKTNQEKIETYFWYPRKRPEATTKP